MKKTIIILAVVLLPLAVFADTGNFGKDGPEYKALESLAAAGAVTLAQGKETLTRAEIADYCMKAIDYLLSDNNEPTAEALETAYINECSPARRLAFEQGSV